ncbi:MAG: choice-of-anchor tandem repeat GloVer-containing protein [Terriglobales bacterium]
MDRNRSPVLLLIVFAVAFGFLTTATPLFGAPKEKVLHYFGKGNDGSDPVGGLILDAAGNLYGTTYWGGRNSCYGVGCGTVFRLTPTENGKWTEKVLYNFGSEGCAPAASLISDAAGNLYGTATGDDCEDNGTVFRLAPGQNDSWTYSALYRFRGGNDGAEPNSSLISDVAGNLYGTTAAGGVFRRGTVFELERHVNGSWTEKVLHSFNRKDGYYPIASLIFDASGNLYGTTPGGGASGGGVVFELTPNEDGAWNEKVLHNFINNGKDGHSPAGVLIFDASGNLYGTTENGGSHDDGTAFELTPGANGRWKERVLYSFDGKDGAGISGGLIFDAAGNLYGTASLGGDGGYGCDDLGCGTAFVLKPAAHGKWTESVLHYFESTRSGGNYSPGFGVISDPAGNLYGTTLGGGCGGSGGGGQCGTVFKIAP